MSSALELSAGQVFAGQFRIVKPLAQGGMGAVYVVEQISTGKKRALKLMLPGAALVDGSRRFEQEARTSSLIPSEHVVDVIAAGVEGPEGIPWLAMELLEGESLEDYLDKSGPLSPHQAYDVLAQLVHALSAAHDLGVVHRDLKPENIFLARSRSSSGEFMVKVLDFGLATIVSPTTKNTTALGSPLWMAPEQTQTDEAITLGTDIWAFGLIVFRMLSGRHYWLTVDGSLVRLMREIVLEPLPSANERSREVGGVALPPGFDEWFAQCVVRFAPYRFAHARDAWQELHTVLVNAGAAPQAPRSLSQRPSTSPPPRTVESPRTTENLAGATALSASRTLLSPSDPDLRRSLNQGQRPSRPPVNVELRAGTPPAADYTRASHPPAVTPAKKRGGTLFFFVALLLAFAGVAAYWFKQTRSPEATVPLAEAQALPSLPAAGTGRVVASPLVQPQGTTPSVATTSPSASATPATSASSTGAPVNRPAKPNAPPLAKPAHPDAKPEKPASTLPDLL